MESREPEQTKKGEVRIPEGPKYTVMAGSGWMPISMSSWECVKMIVRCLAYLFTGVQVRMRFRRGVIVFEEVDMHLQDNIDALMEVFRTTHPAASELEKRRYH